MSLFHISFVSGLMPFALAAAIKSCDTEEDRAFMTALYLSHSKQLFTYALGLCGSRQDAEDAVQDAFLSLISKASMLRTMQPDRLKAYLFTTLKHAVWLAHRKKRNAEAERRRLLKSSSEEIPSFDYTFEDLMEALPRMSEKDQVLLQMKYLLHMTDSEIAGKFKVKTGSVKTMVSRARRRLANLIGEGEGKNVGK